MFRLMQRFLFTLALLVVSSYLANAAGSYQKRLMFDHLVIAGVPRPAITFPSLPEINPSQVLGGCGRGRIRQPLTSSCHGPGDIGH